MPLLAIARLVEAKPALAQPAFDMPVALGTAVLPQLATDGARANARDPMEGYVAPLALATGTEFEQYGEDARGEYLTANGAYGTGRSIHATLASRW